MGTNSSKPAGFVDQNLVQQSPQYYPQQGYQQYPQVYQVPAQQNYQPPQAQQFQIDPNYYSQNSPNGSNHSSAGSAGSGQQAVQPQQPKRDQDLHKLAASIVEDSFRMQFTKASEKQPIPAAFAAQPYRAPAPAAKPKNSDDIDEFVVVSDTTSPKPSTYTAPAAAEEVNDGSTRIGNYKLMNLLGQGSFGKVFQVRPTRIQYEWQKKDLAMKMIQLHDPRLEPLIRQEIDNTKRAKNQFVIELFDILRYDVPHTGESHVCIVMELCSFTLGQLVRSRTLMAQLFPESLIVYLLVTIMEGLQAAHEQHIIHRDIKPDNILLTQELQIKISDFGISKKLVNEHDMTESFIGTVPYMAPEQHANQRYGTGVDVFALGTTLFEVLTCRVITDPNARMSNNIDAFGLENFVRAIPRLYSEDLVYVVERMLTLDASKRGSLAELLEHPLFKPWRIALSANPFQGSFVDPEKDKQLCDANDTVMKLIIKDLKTCAKSDIFIMFNVINKFWIRKEYVTQILHTISQRLGDAGVKRSDIEQCTESEMRKQLRLQFFGHCITCGLVDGEGCCFACLLRCHAGHKVFPYMRLGNCYCDCAHHELSSSQPLPPLPQQQQQQQQLSFLPQPAPLQPLPSQKHICCAYRMDRERKAAGISSQPMMSPVAPASGGSPYYRVPAARFHQ